MTTSLMEIQPNKNNHTERTTAELLRIDTGKSKTVKGKNIQQKGHEAEPTKEAMTEESSPKQKEHSTGINPRRT